MAGPGRARSIGPPRQKGRSLAPGPIIVPVSAIYAVRSLIVGLIMVWCVGLGWHPLLLLVELGALIFWAAAKPLPQSVKNRPKR